MVNQKFTVFSDAHIGIYDNFAQPVKDNNLNDRSLASIQAVAQAFDIAIEKHTHLISVGDLFDKRGTLDVRLVNRVADLFKEKVPQLAKGCNVYLLAGNHDQIDNSDVPENSLKWLQYFSTPDHQVYVIDTVQDFAIDDVVDIAFLPYSENVKASKEQLAQLVKTPQVTSHPIKLLFAHVGVEGAVDGGLYTHRLGGAYGVGDLYPDVFDKIMLGHYHRRQALGATKKTDPKDSQVLYVGSTSQKSFSDEGQDKGVDLITCSAKTGVKDDFIVLESKQFLTIDLADQKYAKMSEQELTNLMSQYYVRVISHDSKEAKQLQKAANQDDIKVAISLQEEQKSANRLGIKVTDSDSKIVKEYAQKYYPEATDTALKVLEKTKNSIA